MYSGIAVSWCKLFCCLRRGLVSTFKLILLFSTFFRMNYLENIRLVSISATVVDGGLLKTSIATNTHSAGATVVDYEINASIISGDQRNTDFIICFVAK